MNIHPTRNHSPVRLLMAFLAILALAAAVPAEAGRWHRGKEYREHGRQRHPHRAYHPVRVGRHRYFYRTGRFYRHHPRRGYVAVRAPIGAVIADLPAGFRIVVSGGTRYFHFGDVYCRPHPRGFRVVAAPAVHRPRPRRAEPRPRWNVPPPSASRHLPDRNWVTVTAEVLNVRSGPGKGHPVIGRVRQGRRLEVEDSAGGWSYVRLPHGRQGWVMNRFTTGVARRPRG
jgi:uncharacterized protein YgiM (DUF1202 family)